MIAGARNVVASVLGRLRNEAKAQSVPFNQILQFYAIERFLSRLSRSPHVDSVLLKGALLLKTVGIPRARPTLDIDLLRQGSADRASLVALVRDCALIEDDSDGVTFDSDHMVVEDIMKDADWSNGRYGSGPTRSRRLLRRNFRRWLSAIWPTVA